MDADQQIAGREAIEQIALDVAQLKISHNAGEAADVKALCKNISDLANDVSGLYDTGN